MVIAILRVIAPPEKREEVLRILRWCMGPTSFRPGFISCQLYQDIDNHNALTLIEMWESQAALESHIRSKDYWKVLNVMELGKEPPEIEFLTVSHTAGMDLIEELRG